MFRIAVLFLSLFPLLLSAQNPPAVLRAIDDTAGLPRVLLIGDSISMGYTEPVRRILAGKFNVHRIPENGGTTTRGVTNLEKWLGAGRWDVIHFNFGLHDIRIMDGGEHQVSLADYEANLRKVVERLKKTGARLIWASTTPVPEGKLNPVRRIADVPAFNQAALRVMRDNSIEVDDLYTLALAQLGKIQRPANVHFTDDGYEVLARQVAAAIAGK
jgi:acyl-CoA thioesterase-1